MATVLANPELTRRHEEIADRIEAMVRRQRDELRTEVEDARVFGGDRWTTGGTDGTAPGNDLATWAMHRYFEAS